MTPTSLYANPFALMREFTEEMDRLFGSAKSAEATGCAMWYPALEFVRRNGNVRITANLPDVTNDEVRVFVDRRALVLEGERRNGSQNRKFHSEIPLPEGLHPDDVTARFTEGMLIVEFPFEEALPGTLRRGSASFS